MALYNEEVPPAAVVEREARRRLIAVEEATAVGDSPVQQFYSGAVVLVTGGSGFLGKQLIEKLFRTFDIKKLYILLRTKKGKTIDERLQRILNNPVYDTLRETRPWFLSRVGAVEGDITKERLGLTDDTWLKLIEEVTVVFHSAATISFSDPLQVATNINVKGTVEMISFGKACKSLRTFVHISTAYSQALNSRNLMEIPEGLSTSPMAPTTLIDFANTMDQSTLDKIFEKFLGKDYPNTYVFTKAVAEEAVRTMSGELPICIVRPSIVIPAYTEPSPGWVDKNSVFGPSGIILGLALGMIHTLISDMSIKIDIVPVDFVNNAVIVAGWETARRRQLGEKETRIYTVGTSNRNSITWAYLTDTLNYDVRNHLSSKAMWYAFCIQTTNKYLFNILFWILQFIPGYVVDGLLMLMGKEPALTKSYKLIYALSAVFSYFTLRSWTFQDDNLLKMYKSLSETDRQIFNMDTKAVDMKELIYLWHIGLRKFILKDNLEGDELARKKQLIFKIATYTIAPIYLYILYKIVTFVTFWLYSLFFM